MSGVITRGIGEGAGFFTRGFGFSVEVIEEVVRVPRFGGVPQKYRVRRTYIVLIIPVYGRILIPIQFTIDVFGTILHTVKLSAFLFGELMVRFVRKIPISSSLLIPFEAVMNGFGEVRRTFTGTVPMVGKKTYRKLKALLTVLNEDD